ncbi:right-handed parallel beta-helix repeat-containing protein, partial [bacterium]|nr:right-handed parallel beta-helix repeat-containing protein [bacterium]
IYAFRGNNFTNFWGYTVPFYAGPTWYVNDASTAGDTYTTAVGDTTGDGSSARPFLTITKALTKAKAGDTIYVDAGTYTETVVVQTANVSLIGADSRVTVIDPPGAKSTSGLVGIKVLDAANVLIKNIGVVDAYDGLWLNYSDSAKIESDSFSGIGNLGIHVKSNFTTIRDNILSNVDMGGYTIQLDSGQNTIRDNTVDSGSYGMLVTTESNVIRGNTVSNHLNIGVYLNVTAAYGNLIESNVLTGNGTWGLYLSGSDNRAHTNRIEQNVSGGVYISAPNNRVRFNRIYGNTAVGLEIADPTTWVEHNDIIGNDTGVFVNTASAGISLRKNNIHGNPVNNFRNAYSASHFADGNWFGGIDSDAIGAKVTAGFADIDPWRLGPIDTAPGADTVAPKAPDTVAVIGAPSDTSIILEWSPVTQNEEGVGAPSVSGYRIYRSRTKDTSSWIKVGQVPVPGNLRFQDTSAGLGNLYYYRVTAFDGASPFQNESFFSDSQPSDSAVLSAAVNIYVNDTSASGDSYTGAAGSDVTGAGTRSQPLRTLVTAMRWATTGDTIWIDAGTYDSYVVVSATETAALNIDKDSITLVGADSALTIIDPPGASSIANLYGLYADTQTGLAIRNLRVTGAWVSVGWVNVDLSTLATCNIGGAGAIGAYLENAGNNRLINNLTNANVNYGLRFIASNSNTVTGNSIKSQSTHGVYMTDNSSNNTFTDNDVSLTTGDGFNLSGDGNVIDTNVISSNSNDGIELSGATNSKIRHNRIESNGAGGVFFLGGATGNLIAHNRIVSNVWMGVDITNSDSNTVVQNDISSSDTGVWIEPGTSAYNVIQKNNITGNALNHVLNSAGNPQTLTRNWFGSADSAAIGAKISDTGNSWTPWRLSIVDTAAVADTTAPKAPDTVEIPASASGGSDTSIILEWTAVTAEEEGVAGAPGLGGYAVYRSTVKDTSSWIKVAEVYSGIRYQDTDVTLGQVYYYRIVSFDAATVINKSFFSDSQPSDSAQLGATVNIYVNDGSTAGDSFTTAAGSDITGLGTKSKPFASLPMAMRFATAGDTIWLDAGLYDSYVVVNGTETAGVRITVDNLAIIGKDSNAAVIDPPGPKTQAGLYGIYADTRTGLLIKNLGVLGAYEGIEFVNVDQSTVTGDSVSSCGDNGINLMNGSDTNTVSGNMSNFNFYGIYLTSSSGNTVSNNVANSNTAGIHLTSSSNSNTVSGNTASGNTDGFDVASSSNNTLSNNTASSNGTNGFYVLSASGNTLSGNTANSNAFGINLNSSSSNTITGNTTTSNSSRGIWVSASTNNTVSSNVTSSNNYGVHVEGASTGNRVTANTSTSNLYGIRLETNADTNVVVNNLFNSNTLYGIHVVSSSDNTISQNDARNNTEYQVYIQGS